MSTWTARPAEPSDYEAFTRLLPELRTPDPTPSPERWRDDLCRRAVILETDGAPVGYGLWAILREAAHVIHVVIGPEARGRGAGRALMQAIATQIQAAGAERWYLYVKTDNTPAIGLYERFGFTRHHDATALAFPWSGLANLPRAPETVLARPAKPEEDAALESAFELPSGGLAQYGRGPGQVVYRLIAPERPDDMRIGVATFDPAFPGGRYLAVARPALATALLEALQPLARPGDAIANLMIEGDPELVAILIAAGARVHFELVQMTGRIPRGA